MCPGVPAGMAGRWEVVGGSDKGGILVREGQDLKSEPAGERLSRGAIVEELALVGDRLNYQLITGSGPVTGWVSLKAGGHNLVVRKGAQAVPAKKAAAKSGKQDSIAGVPLALAALEEDLGGPAEAAGEVEVDEALKKRLEGQAEAKRLEGALLQYCAKYEALGYPLEEPRLRVICFHNEGSAESNFTGPGTALRAWAEECRAVEVCAVDYPGRGKLLKARRPATIEALALELLAVLHAKLADAVPYAVWGHGVGAWVAFELLLVARAAGLPMPLAGLFMAFPAPHLPLAQRKWHKNAGLNEKQFREEVINWDRSHFTGAGKVIFEDLLWEQALQPLLRADFCLFDEYRFQHKGAPRFSFPIHAWHFEAEHYCCSEHVEMWKEWTVGSFDFQVMQGMGHLTCFYKPELRRDYFKKVTEILRGHSGL